MHNPLHTITENALMRLSAITSIPARRRIAVIIAAIVIVLAACIPAALEAQSPLPVKDFSVGSQYTYRTPNGTSTEVVLRDTTILGRTYGVVQTFGVIKYLRSDTTAIYEYNPRTNRESTVFQFGQMCATSPGMGWFPQDSACTQVFATPMQIQYGIYGSRYLSNNIDTYDGRFVEYMKPFGFINYFSKRCWPVYLPGSLTRPPQYSGEGWSQNCDARVSTELVSAKLGQKIPVQLRLSFSSSRIASYGNKFKLSLELQDISSYAKFVQLPTQAQLQLTIDTAGIYNLTGQILSSPEQPLQIAYIRQGKAVIQVNVPISQTNNNYIYTLSFRSRSLQQRKHDFTVEMPGPFSDFNVQPLSEFVLHTGTNIIYAVAPNPAKDKISLTFAMDYIGNLNLSLLDIKGSVVKYKEIRHNPGFFLTDMEISDVPPGMYIINAVSSSGEIGSYKIMVIK